LDKDKNEDDDGLEEAVRARVRRMLSEAPYDRLAFSGWDLAGEEGDEDEEGNIISDEEPARKNLTVSDTEGEVLKKIAKEFGLSSPSAATGFIDRTLETYKHQWLLNKKISTSGGSELDKFMLSGAEDYIKYLNSLGELNTSDVNYMRMNVDLVMELDGFREFMHNKIRAGIRKMRASGEWDA